MPKKHYTFEILRDDRRRILKLGAVGIAGTAILPACDRLVLPELDLLEQLPDILTNEDFYLQSAFGTPDLDPEAHVFRILAEGQELASIDLDYVRGLQGRVREHTIQCIGASPRFLFIGNARWTGLPFNEILADLGVTPPANALWMKITGADGYATGLPISDIEGSDDADPLWLVWQMNGEDLPLAHGAPFRFLTPGRYGTKNPKWPTELDFVVEEFIGHWEERGWSQEATYRLNALVLSPPSMAVVGAGNVAILGSAFSGHNPIASVDVTLDGGDTWEAAEITYGPALSETAPDITDGILERHIWTTWRYDWMLDEPGEFHIQVRATDTAGNTTATTDTEGANRLDGYDAGMEIAVRVT
jgi:hypothetical protein